jgi:hypothetical protein
MKWLLCMVCMGAVVAGGGMVWAQPAEPQDEMPPLEAPGPEPPPDALKYDDGTMEGKRSMAGGGHAVLFHKPDPADWYVDRVYLFGARYGGAVPPDEDFTIYVTDKDLQRYCMIPRPYSLFERGAERWVEIPLPPVHVPDDFYVCFVFQPTQTKGVFVGYDESVAESHSKQAVPDSHCEDVEKPYDWMIRTHLTQTPEGEALELLDAAGRAEAQQKVLAAEEEGLLKGSTAHVLQYDDGEMDGFQSYGGPTAQTVAFDAPAGGPWYVYRVAVYGSRYGGQIDADDLVAEVYLLDEEGRPVTSTAFPHSRFGYQQAWVQLDTLPTRVAGRFYVAVYAHSQQDRGLYIGYDTDIADSHSKVGSVRRTQFEFGEPREKWEWMIRVKLTDRPVVYP